MPSPESLRRWAGEATLAGLYARGSHPQGRRPALGITAAVEMPRGASTRARDLVHLTGPIPDLLDDAMNWIARNTPTDIGRDPLVEFTGLHVSQVRWSLNKLIDAGFVEMLGKQGQKTTRYGRTTPPSPGPRALDRE